MSPSPKAHRRSLRGELQQHGSHEEGQDQERPSLPHAVEHLGPEVELQHEGPGSYEESPVGHLTQEHTRPHAVAGRLPGIEKRPLPAQGAKDQVQERGQEQGDDQGQSQDAACTSPRSSRRTLSSCSGLWAFAGKTT